MHSTPGTMSPLFDGTIMEMVLTVLRSFECSAWSPEYIEGPVLLVGALKGSSRVLGTQNIATVCMTAERTIVVVPCSSTVNTFRYSMLASIFV